MFKLTLPDEFFLWLKKWISAGSVWTCERILVRKEGRLVFEMKRGGEPVSLSWMIAESDSDGISFREGSIVAFPSAEENQAAAQALKHLLERLSLLFLKFNPPLLDKRNREVSEIPFGEHTASFLFGEILTPALKLSENIVFSHTSFESETLRLHFSDGERETIYNLRPSEAVHNENEIMRRGPLVLTDPLGNETEADFLPGYLGYILSLTCREGMRLVEEIPRPLPPDQDQQGASEDFFSEKDRIELSRKQFVNPFFKDEALDEIDMFNAFFACKGEFLIATLAERECLHYFLPLNSPADSHYLQPWKVFPKAENLNRIYFTDMTEVQAVMLGDGGRLENLLQELMPKINPRLLMVLDSCVSMVVGDEIEGVLKNLKEENEKLQVCSLKVMRLGQPDNFPLLWKHLVEHNQKAATTEKRQSVNLIGYGYERTPSLPELCALLESIGHPLNIGLLPSFDLTELDRFGDAALNLLYPSHRSQMAFRYASPLCSAPVLTADAPYGFENTLKWLNSIRTHFGETPLNEEHCLEYAGKHFEQWHNLKQRSRGRRAAVIILDIHWSFEADPLCREGVPWLSCLDEMGFGLDLIVLNTFKERSDSDKIRNKIVEHLPFFENSDLHRIIQTDCTEDVVEVLKLIESDIVYSERRNDERITALGKTPFSILDFEMGFAGACRTLERLLSLCELPFYRRYARYLERGRKQS